MSSSESNSAKGIMSFLANLPLIRRIKIIKELILEKLDQILSKSNNLEAKSNSMLENQMPLMQAATNIAEALKTIYQQSQNQYNFLVKIIQENYHNLQNLLQNSQSQNSQLNKLEEKIENLNQNVSLFLQKSLDNNEKMENILEQITQKSKEGYNKILEVLGNIETELKENKNEEIGIIKQICQDSLYQQEEIESLFVNSTSKLLIVNQSSKELSHPEVGLMTHLYSFLPNRYAIDIGANIGDVSESLLKAGYEVYAFEPFAPVYEKLKSRLGDNSNFHCTQIALGSQNETREFYLATDKSKENIYQDSSLYNSLIKHSMPDDLPFTDTTTVTVKTLATLQEKREIPSNLSLVKIDTEGFDLEVIKGMGYYKYPVVVAEFWDSQFPFGISETFNKLEDLVAEMQKKNYYWYIVLYQVWGSQEKAFYCNYPQSVKNSWGNVFFFQDYEVFVQARLWCSAILTITHFRI